MRCGKTDLCSVKEVRYAKMNPYRYIKYHVTWTEKITPLSVFSEKFAVLYNMMTKGVKSSEVGLHFTYNSVLWLSGSLLYSMSLDGFMDQVLRSMADIKFINGVVFDNMDDVEIFVDRLEKKYIWKVLKE
jgi:hypothetical protein